MNAANHPPLACGCNQRRGCSLGALLARTGRWEGVARHLEEQRDKTSPIRRARIYAWLHGVKLEDAMAMGDGKAAG